MGAIYVRNISRKAVIYITEGSRYMSVPRRRIDIIITVSVTITRTIPFVVVIIAIDITAAV
jgi:ABC-type methionine transport system permease subunit